MADRQAAATGGSAYRSLAAVAVVASAVIPLALIVRRRLAWAPRSPGHCSACGADLPSRTGAGPVMPRDSG